MVHDIAVRFGTMMRTKLQSKNYSFLPWKTCQFSTAQVWAQAQNGPHDQLNNIQAGWMVYPHLYHDNRTRLFTYWTADGFHNTGCFNILCPVFVKIDKTFTPSMVLQPISVYGGTQYVIYVNVYQDLATKNWWLMVTNRNIVVGYWPSAIFSYLNEGASSVVWGAVAQSSPDHISPPMGSGHFPYDNYNHSCFFTNMKFMNRFNKVMNADGLKKFVNNTNCYDIKDDRYKSKELEHSLRFGGRGGNCYLLPQSSKGPLFSIRM
ncbi:hypothetical protein NE237_029964 [Protea cynaroides]|uniref:Neprosin PEP catalytic domain-containing protein n=1 Tax=Protea cynaroides TaxID=273540 RepID=A0A9Q0JVL3_9MAGN|nr:hypothetical protein NE237_029964 [Protea cynaroides]